MPRETIDPRYQPFLYDYVSLEQRQWVVGEKINGHIIAESFLTEREERFVELRKAVEEAGLSWALLEEYATENINEAALAA